MILLCVDPQTFELTTQGKILAAARSVQAEDSTDLSRLLTVPCAGVLTSFSEKRSSFFYIQNILLIISQNYDLDNIDVESFYS